jgi:hypothetical protein
MRQITATLAAWAIAFTGPALAAPFDGSQPLICATFELHSCEVGTACEKQGMEQFDAPRFLHISVADKKITGTRPSGSPIDATIEGIRHSQNMMFLHGAQDAFVWTVSIGETDGTMAVTVSDNDSGMVIFGACTPR